MKKNLLKGGMKPTVKSDKVPKGAKGIKKRPAKSSYGTVGVRG